jgi:hypothetical protein
LIAVGFFNAYCRGNCFDGQMALGQNIALKILTRQGIGAIQDSCFRAK